MKLETEKQEKDKIENVKEQVQEIQTKLEYSFNPQKNHILYEYHLANKTLEVVEFDELPNVKWEDAVKGNISLQKKITKKENCIYISALNKKNAIKKLNKL